MKNLRLVYDIFMPGFCKYQNHTLPVVYMPGYLDLAVSVTDACLTCCCGWDYRDLLLARTLVKCLILIEQHEFLDRCGTLWSSAILLQAYEM